MMKTLQIDVLIRIEKSNLNSQLTEGNITTLKKFKDVDGREYIYVSATSVKYWLKERMNELIPEIWKNDKNSPRISKPEKSEVLYTPAKPITYIDADLFGYLDARNNKKRYAPIKFSGLISLYPYQGDIDFGVRYDPEGTEHTLHHIEITSNLFRGTWMILLDWIGRFISQNMNEEAEKLNNIKDSNLKIGLNEFSVKELPIEERRKRLKLFLKALFTMQHFTKQTNLLTDTQPRFAMITLTKVAKPVIFDRLSATIENKNGKKVIVFKEDHEKSLKEAILQHKDIIEKIVIVYDPATVELPNIIEKKNNKYIIKLDNSKEMDIDVKTISEFLEENNLEGFVNEVIKT